MRDGSNLKKNTVQKFKALLKKCVYLPSIYWAYSGYHRWRQNRVIELEQAEYEERARRIELLRDWPIDEVRKRLHHRLARRSITPVLKSRNELHVVYASGESPWDVINIVPALQKFAKVTTYLLSDYGFNPQKSDWVRVRDKMNVHFIDFIWNLHRTQPIDFILTYYSGHHVSAETIEKINDMGIVTTAFHLDDRLSFRSQRLGNRWRGPAAVAKAYDLNLTQAPESLVKYRVEGGIPLLWPSAANPDLCYPRNGPFKYDVSLVGTAYGNRISMVNYLRKHGVEVATFGQGWPSGFLPADYFQEIYCASRINLNFDDIAFTHYQCGKIRDFEIPMCGALMLSTHNEHLRNYFDIGSEIFTFRTPEECLKQIRYLLANEKLCEEARKQARVRALREHTWEKRVRSLLNFIGYIA